ncbi:DUF4268 domain-containing protein [Sphingomonadaceae bacterium OTU29LAMAA1]|nr:DUF4268 domain-containing protein [Sphingomonadaceae bacterium OTU29LAMAA1]
MQTVDLREVWPSEPYNFTPWLAQADNLEFLAESLGLPGLELVKAEHAVDSFSADIVARIVDSEHHVLIENQLERTDHTHLGQLLTYAPRFDAKVIVWVARQFTEAHRAALDWLNSITDERYAFFGVEVQAVRIGDSMPAPQFNVVAKPNSWTRTASTPATGSGESQALSEVALSNIDYWTMFHETAAAAGAPLRRVDRPLKDTNYWVPIAERGDAYLSVYRSHARKPSIGVFVGLYNAPLTFVSEQLVAQREVLTAAYGEALDWQTNREGVVAKVALKMPVADPTDRDDWPRQHMWMIAQLKQMEQVFVPAVTAALAAFDPEAAVA